VEAPLRLRGRDRRPTGGETHVYCFFIVMARILIVMMFTFLLCQLHICIYLQREARERAAAVQAEVAGGCANPGERHWLLSSLWECCRC